MNEVERSWRQLEDAYIQELLSAKKRWIVGCLSRILPEHLFELARASQDQPRVQKYCTEQGYRWVEQKGKTLLVKGTHVIGQFKPVMVGTEGDKHCEFVATCLGEQIPVSDPVKKVTLN